MLWEVVTQGGDVELRAATSGLWCEDETQLCIFSRGGEAGRIFGVGFEVSSGGDGKLGMVPLNTCSESYQQ